MKGYRRGRELFYYWEITPQSGDREVTVYEASNGKRFDNLRKAITYEAALLAGSSKNLHQYNLSLYKMRSLCVEPKQ